MENRVMQPTGVPYADDFFNQPWVSRGIRGQPCVDGHATASQQLFKNGLLQNTGKFTPIRGGANGTIFSYPSNEKTYIVKLRDPSIVILEDQADGYTLCRLQDPTHYEMVNAIYLEWIFKYIPYYEGFKGFFTNIITCAQLSPTTFPLTDEKTAAGSLATKKRKAANAANAADRNAANVNTGSKPTLATALFVESIPDTVRTLGSVLIGKNDNLPFLKIIQQTLYDMMFSLFELGYACGFWHGDLHVGNILIHIKDNKIHNFAIIDFGRAYVHVPFLLEINNKLGKIDDASTRLSALDGEIQNACAKLLPCNLWDASFHKDKFNVTASNAYEHILSTVFEKKYNHFNRHAHLTRYMTSLKKPLEAVHPIVFKTMILGDIAGFMLSLCSKTYLVREFKDPPPPTYCTIEGLVVMLTEWGLMDKVCVIENANGTYAKITNANKLLEELATILPTIDKKKEKEKEYTTLKKACGLWLLLYLCIVHELAITSTDAYIIENILQSSTRFYINQAILGTAFCRHGQPKQITRDFIAVWDGLWKRRIVQTQTEMQSQSGGVINAFTRTPAFEIAIPEEIYIEETDMDMAAAAEHFKEPLVLSKSDRLSDTDLKFLKTLRTNDIELTGRGNARSSCARSVGSFRSFGSFGSFGSVGPMLLGSVGGTRNRAKITVTKKKTSDTHRYKQRDYVVYEGSRGGRYIRLKGAYVSLRSLH